MCKHLDDAAESAWLLAVTLPTDLLIARINKLSILGVRSFDNQYPETIQFYSPLTLIVGLNGSGKTTIIECLKYATTGDMPPNSKGGSFVHDPKLCNEKEVLAQVKIRFDATNGVEHILTRRSQLTVKKSTRQFKTLEGSLVSITNGERSAISSRVAELDQLMPHYLGVSKAVLDNVIFCHQEESLWPMSEPSKLKIKFDEIFEALKYTKAIDNLKQVRKAQNIRLDKLKLNEKFTKENKDKGEKAERQSKLLDAELNGLREEITELEAKVREAEHEHQEAWDHAAKYNHVVESLNAKEEKRVWLEKDVSGLRQDLQERSESDEWLQCEVDQYEERTAVHEQIRQQQLKQYDSLTRAIDEGVKKLSNKHIEAGKYEEQRDNHEQDIERRKGLIRDSSRRHSIRGYDTDLDDMQINEYMARISRLSKDQTAAVEKARRETEREANRARELLSKLGERKSALNTERNSLKQQSDANDRNIGIFLADINAIEFDESGKAILQSKIEDIAARLQKAKDDSKKGSWDSKLQESNAQLRAIKDESEQLNRDLVQGTKQASELARLAHWKDEAEDRKRNLEKMKAVHGVRLQKLMNQSWAPSSLEAEFQKAVDQKTHQLKEAERQRELVSRTLEQVNYKLSNAGTDIKKVEKEIAACVKRLKDSAECEPEEYAKTLSEMQEARDLFKADSDNFENLRKYFTKGIETAQKKHECNMCQRAFHGAEEREFVARLRQKLANETAAQVQKDLDDAEEDLRKAKEAGPSHATWVRLSTVELPKLREEIKRLGLDREKILSETEHHDQAVKEHEAARVDVESLAKPVRDIAKNYQESVNLSGQINEFTANQTDIGMSRTLDEIQEQLEVNGGRSQSLENTIAKIRTDKECARSQISTLELDLTKEKSKLSDANHQLDRKAIMYKQIEELRSVNQEHQGTAKQLALQLQELEPQICEEQTKLDDLTQRGQDKEKALQQEASKLADTVHKLELAERNIQVYLQDGGPAKLARCQREIDNIQREMDQGKAERNRVTVSINKIKEEIDRHREIRRTILDNIKYRQRVRDLEICQTEIANLSAQNDEADRAHWQRQATHWRHILDEVLARKQSKIGTAKAKDEQLGKLIEDWQTDYKDSAVEYKKAHIEVETTKAAIEDLGRYGAAMDHAIMAYHSIKMEEINRIIEELWKSTYQGTDVDTIMIRSDNEAAKGTRSSYNYRVCMVKQDAEMDMRGRCSAGQKVLASIIIRLALAECFGVNCGLIALDEPTTNLDRDNIRALANSLHNIIKARRRQSNFQLIVITHDEDFLKQMNCPDFCDYYYRVSRNDRQKSEIARQSIAEVM